MTAPLAPRGGSGGAAGADGSTAPASGRETLSLLALRLAEAAGFLEQGLCARAAALPAGRMGPLLAREAARLRARTGGALPPWALPSTMTGEEARAAAALLSGEAPALESLCTGWEALSAGALGRSGRRAAGLYYTPPEVAAQVVELALAHGLDRERPRGAQSGAPRPRGAQSGAPLSRGAESGAQRPRGAESGALLPRVVDPCAGAGIFLAAAARALALRSGRPGALREALLRCGGSDLDPEALHVARAALLLLAGPSRAKEQGGPDLRALDALRDAPGPPADLLVSNPPYGHLDDPRERAFLAARLPGLRGGEIDRYAAFLLRSVELVRPGGTVALLIPDTWMTKARGRPLREALLAQAELAAVADLGKPFAAAKDTRVQALVLVRRLSLRCLPVRRSLPGAGRAAAPADSLTTGSPTADLPADDSPTYVARAERGRLVALAELPSARLHAGLAPGFLPYRSRAEDRLCSALEAASVPLAQLCEVGYGLRTGDNARHVRRGTAPHRPGEIGLCGGEDVLPFALRWRPKALAAPTPALLALAARQLGRPRVAVQRIRTNAATPWSRWLEAAPVPPNLVCLDSLSTLAAPEAGESGSDLLWALLGLLASVALNRWYRLRTTDVNVKPSLLRELPVPRALLLPGPRAQLAALARARATELVQSLEQQRPAHELRAPALAQRAPALRAPALERSIDARVYLLYDLSAPALREAELGFWGERFSLEFPRLSDDRPAAMSDPSASLLAEPARRPA